jgi:hypothetical protein
VIVYVTLLGSVAPTVVVKLVVRVTACGTMDFAVHFPVESGVTWTPSTLGRKVFGSVDEGLALSTTENVNPASGGALTWKPPTSLELPPPGFVTITSRSPVAVVAVSPTLRCCPVPSLVTDVTVTPLAGVVVPVLRNWRVAPLWSFVPARFTVTDPGGALDGVTTDSLGFVTVKATPLLARPLFVTSTGPSNASAVFVGKAGTATVSDVDVLLLMVAMTGVLAGPVNVTTGVEPKLLPLTLTVLPRSPDEGTRLEITGGVAVPLGAVFGASPWAGQGLGLPTSRIGPALVPVPVSGFVTVMLRDPVAPGSTSTSAESVVLETKLSPTSVIPVDGVKLMPMFGGNAVGGRKPVPVIVTNWTLQLA